MSPSLRTLALAFLAGCTASSSLPGSTPDSGPVAGATGSADAAPSSSDAAPSSYDAQPAPDAATIPDARAAAPETRALAEDAPPFTLPDGLGGITFDGPSRDLPLPPDARQIFFDALPTPPDAPPIGGEAKLLVPGRARLVGTHLTACTNAVPASGNGDRWCAFTLPNRQIGLTDLWVIDVTKALAGTAITCNGTDPNCKLLIPPGGTPALGTQLWTGQPMDGPIHPTTHRFDGDTLIFHALASDTANTYSGPIFAWRPGWDAPRKISYSNAAYSCSAHFTAESFVCIENLTATMPLQFDLTGGTPTVGAQLIKHVVPFRAGSQSSQWRAALSRDGQSLAFSTGGLTIAERETFYVTRFDAPQNVTMVKAGVSRWSLSADGTKVYYLANYNYDTMGAPSGTLTVMDFPSGANERTLAPMVGAVQVLADGAVDKGIAFFDAVIAGKANYKIMKDPTMPTQVTTVITNIGGVVALSRDLRFLVYYRDFNMDNGSTTDSYVVKTDGSMTTCTLTTTLDADQFGAPFTPNGSMVFWVDNVDQIDGVGEAWVANPDGCTGRRKYADRMDFWFLRGNDGMVFSDQGQLDYSTLEAMPFPGGNSLGTATALQPQVNRIYGIVPDFKGILFTVVNSPASTDGIYLLSKLPF